MGDNFFNNFFGQTGVNSPFHKPPFTGNFNPGGNMNGEARSENGQHNRNTNVNNNRLYNILGVDKGADNKAIRKAYLKCSTTGDYRHPDKGGDEEKFKELSQAYEILKDKEKRKDYDTYGEDIFDSDFEQKKAFNTQFSGGPFGFHRTTSQGPTNIDKPIQKGQPSLFPLKLSLDELCKNTTKRIKITRKVVFEKPSENNNNTYIRIQDERLEKVWNTCDQCGGRGIIQRIQQLRPGMVQQIQMPCQNCQGTGHELNDIYEIRETSEIVEVFIEKGTTHGTKLKYRNKGNVSLGRIPGDLYIVIEEIKHPIYTRKENDLLMKRDITLDESLFGRRFYIKHLDGRIFDVNLDGVITPANNIRCIEGGGMPIKGDTTNGKLFIYFTIKFPTKQQLNVHPTMKQKLQDILSSIPQYKNDVHQNDFIPNNNELEESQPFNLDTIDISEFGRKQQQHRNAHDSDDEDEMHHEQPTQCRPM